MIPVRTAQWINLRTPFDGLLCYITKRYEVLLDLL